MPSASAAAAAGYRSRPASNQLKKIVEENLEELLRAWDERFRDTYGPLHRRVRTVLEGFLRCGDAHFGFVRLLCCNPHCPKKTERILPYACRGKGLCPSCGQKRPLAWAERMVEEVLPIVTYRQLVFTIPRTLRKPFLFDRSLYGDLCRVAYASTRDFLRRQAAGTFRGVAESVPLMIVSPQSFGDILVAHPHGHACVSLGLFRPDGVFLPLDDVDFSGLEEVFRERFFRLMLRREKVRPETVERMRAWEHSGFAVHGERRIDRFDRKGLEGLLSYMERAPVSLRRLTYRDDGLVHYQGTRFHPRLGTDHQILPPLDFLALLVPHIALWYEVTIPLLRRPLHHLPEEGRVDRKASRPRSASPRPSAAHLPTPRGRAPFGLPRSPFPAGSSRPRPLSPSG